MISAAVGLLSAFVALHLSNDTPSKRFYKKDVNSNEGSPKLHLGSVIQAGKHPGTWILAFQYACSAGANSALMNMGVLHMVGMAGATSSEA